MSKPGKKTVDAQRRYDREQLFAPTEAMDLVKAMATRNFDESVEAAFRLGVDPRKADQMIRGTVSLPNGTGRTSRVAVFAQGDAAREAQEAGLARWTSSRTAVKLVRRASMSKLTLPIGTWTLP